MQGTKAHWSMSESLHHSHCLTVMTLTVSTYELVKVHMHWLDQLTCGKLYLCKIALINITVGEHCRLRGHRRMQYELEVYWV